MIFGAIFATASILLVVFGNGGIVGLIISIAGLMSVITGIILWIIGEVK